MRTKHPRPRLHALRPLTERNWRLLLVNAAGRHDQYRTGGLAALVRRAAAAGAAVSRSLRWLLVCALLTGCSADLTDIAGYNWRVASLCDGVESSELVDECVVTDAQDMGTGEQRSLICDVDGATVEMFVRCTPALPEQTASLDIGGGCQVALACKGRM